MIPPGVAGWIYPRRGLLFGDDQTRPHERVVPLLGAPAGHLADDGPRGPFLAAVIARLAEPKHNLAAYGVAFALAILVEAPVIMMMSASTALVDSAGIYRRLRNFMWMLNVGITAVMLLLLLTPLWSLLTDTWMGLDAEVARLTRTSLYILLPWPAAIGYRRFYQGLLIRAGLTRRVAWGTVIRLVVHDRDRRCSAAATDLPGAWVGAVALSTGGVSPKRSPAG